MKNKLGSKMMKKIVRLRAKTYSYLIVDSGEDNKAKGTKKSVANIKLNFEDYKTV